MSDDDDDESTWPPPPEREVLPLRSDYASANGDFRYQHTSLTVAYLADGWEVAMLGQYSRAHFHLERELAVRVADELEAVLRKSMFPRLFDAEEGSTLPPAPPPAPQSAFYSPFPTICQDDDPFVRVQFALSRVELQIHIRKASILITVDQAVAGWLQNLLKGSPPGRGHQ